MFIRRIMERGTIAEERARSQGDCAEKDYTLKDKENFNKKRMGRKPYQNNF